MLLARRAQMFTKKPRLPGEYQEVEWISDRTEQEYLNTGVIPDNETGIHIEIAASDITTDHYWWGCLNGTGKRFLAGGSSARIYLGWNTNGWMPQGTSITANVFNTVEMNYYNSRKRIVNDINAPDITETLNAIGYSVNLWRTNNQGSTGYSHGTKKIRSCIFTRGSEKIRDFVPCYRKSDGVIGMYDLVEGGFYRNAGLGSFLKGSDVND